MENKLVISLNNEAVIEYDRNKRLPGHQRAFLDKMDVDMQEGINLHGEDISSPDQNQRAQFVATHLVQGLLENDDGLIAAMCAYLANRMPELKQVKVAQDGETYSIDLIFDRVQENQVKVAFEPKLH